ATAAFTGNLDADFAGAQIIAFGKGDETKARAALSYDTEHLYIGWDIADQTPWQNGAAAPEDLYLSGDTVDFQFGADRNADPKPDRGRGEAVLGDFRLSIGNFKGAATAMLYRKVAREKHPKTFS